MSHSGFVYQGGKVIVSVVAYTHPEGIPARFCVGLISAVQFSREIPSSSVEIRIIDPSPIANYCNGWKRNDAFQDIVVDFLTKQRVEFFFDRAEEVTEESLKILEDVGRVLESSSDQAVREMVGRIKDSGRRHGGAEGERNALLYMAAHPFSWLDMYHPLIWRRSYSPEAYQFVNMMSKAESRFTLIRKSLKERLQLASGITPTESYMTLCNTPCYIPLPREPLFPDFVQSGYAACLERYRALKGVSENHRRALRDFEALAPFLSE
ncbi:hypothetical protein KBD61_03245 [Patescibacteria group bacterium]|nr:hypothetical protein [Patescibacteria group bacterium]MBP9710011.1 hypothetical protein [Patescibacteria group bacterium]